MLRKRATLYPNASLLGNASISRAEKRTTNFSEVTSQDALLLRWEKVCVVSRGISLLLEALREITRLIPQGRRQRRAWDRTTALMPLLSCCKNLLNRSPRYCTMHIRFNFIKFNNNFRRRNNFLSFASISPNIIWHYIIKCIHLFFKNIGEKHVNSF